MIRFAAIVVGMLLSDLLCWRLSVRWLRRYRARSWTVWLFHAFFVIQVAYVVAVIVAAASGASHVRRGFDWIPKSAQATIYIWHLVGLPISLLMWLGVGGVRGVAGLVVRYRNAAQRAQLSREGQETASEPDPKPAGMSRRDFLVASVATVPPLLAIGTTGYGLRQTWQFRINPMTLTFPALPQGLDGFTIAHVSDLHVGRWSTEGFLEDVVQSTNALNADVVLFTGDLIDMSIVDLPRAIQVARRLKGRHGLFVVEGNHDLIESPMGFRDAIHKSDLRFLWNSASTLDHNGTPVQLLGLPWASTEGTIRGHLPHVLAHRDPAAFPILMAHHPHAFDAAAEAGLPLVLSGHTHGGQLALSREMNIGNALFRYVSGLYRKGNSQLVVSNGTGNWFPLRVNAPAEILHLTLRKGS